MKLKEIKRLKKTDFLKGQQVFLFIDTALSLDLSEFEHAQIASMGIDGPYGPEFTESFSELVEKGRSLNKLIAVLGIVSHDFYVKRGRDLLNNMRARLQEVQLTLSGERTAKDFNSNESVPLKFLVVYDFNKDVVAFDRSPEVDYIELASLVDKPGKEKKEGASYLLKKLSLECTQVQLHNKLIETQVANQEVFDIGHSLGSERDIGNIMHSVLSNSLRITKADSGSIAIVGFDKNLKRTKNDILTYFVTINRSREINFSRFSMAISKQSLGGYVALTKEMLNIEDAYQLSPDLDYTFNRSFDEQTKYRTKSMLVIPMINQKNNEVIGIIQLLNKKHAYETVIDYENFSEDMIVSFSEDDVKRMQSITPFATISLQNALLYGEIDQLLLGFVEASVSAVEQRDPATSGHSFRVASYTLGLAKACIAVGESMRLFHFDEEQQKEMEYAALLHDFGKIGVREHILVKPKKIQPEEMKNLLKRIEIFSMQLQLDFEKRKTEYLMKHRSEDEEAIGKWIENNERALDEELRRVKRFRIAVIKANEPALLEKGVEVDLEEIKNTWVTTDYSYERLISDREYFMLKIRKGTLSVNERKEIENHVNHTYEFLRRIPWTNELSMVPEIALAHHEKLDGSGYPFGLPSNKIPAQTKIITVCDIFDALVASDRPYKRAVKKEVAFDILMQEADEGKLEKQLVDIFIARKVFKSP